MPQPIDPNTEILRISAAERIQQIADRLSLASQARHASELAEKQVGAESQVLQAQQKSEQVEQELRRRNPFLGRRRHGVGAGREEAEEEGKSGEPETAETPEPPVIHEEHQLDITI